MLLAETRPEIVDLWGLGGPGGPTPIGKCGGRSPSPFPMGVGAAGAAQTPTSTISGLAAANAMGFWGRRGRPDPPTSTISGLAAANAMGFGAAGAAQISQIDDFRFGCGQ